METFSEAIIEQLRVGGYEIHQDGMDRYIYFINSEPNTIYPDLRGFLLKFNDDEINISAFVPDADKPELIRYSTEIVFWFDITNPKFDPMRVINRIEKLFTIDINRWINAPTPEFVKYAEELLYGNT